MTAARRREGVTLGICYAAGLATRHDDEECIMYSEQLAKQYSNE